MDGLNHSVITGKCSGCAALRAELGRAWEKLEAVGKWADDFPDVQVSELDRILKGGD